jgi:hypothetical protein
MREFIKSEVGEFPYKRWAVTDYYISDEPPQVRDPNIEDMTIMRSDGKNFARISGGPVVAYFIKEKDAQDYCDYRNRNLSKPLVINSGEFKI